MLFWSMANFLSQLTYFGSDRGVSMVSHPVTSLSFTMPTLVPLIDPERV